jgi:dienelactone hydrolase
MSCLNMTCFKAKHMSTKVTTTVLFLFLISLMACVSSSSTSQPVKTRPGTLPVPEKVDFPVELQNLQAQWQRVKNKYDRLPVNELQQMGEAQRLGISTTGFMLDRVQKVFRDEEKKEALAQVPLAKMDLDLAESLVGDLELKKNPFANRKGDMYLAYRSELDNSLQPFRLYVPENLSLSSPAPLVVGLHGRTGDEHSIMDAYGDRQGSGSIFKEKGKQYGFILATPKGREADLGYQNAAEKDVLDVTKIILRVYNINPQSIFLMGHSMGGGGTMLIGLKNPTLYKALAPIAGGLWVAGGMKSLSEEAANLPVRFYQGSDDQIVPADPNALESTKEKLNNFQYREFPGEDHSSIFFRTVPEVFAFFAGQMK